MSVLDLNYPKALTNLTNECVQVVSSRLENLEHKCIELYSWIYPLVNKGD